MKFTTIILAMLAAVALAAPVPDDAPVEARAADDVNDLAARQWQCFNCSGGKRQCCGPLGVCYTTNC
ncbi:hypothetical protein CSOJ01_12133 [Colletotrichum sojae]|uniref:Uncharacterized protein n=1 Tax=Colletotrichum sojae TaxID=2175907 RepID=A0A8H6MM69_9PEZI|nr:hypothetical protein CSOJ01_12133 [Colletotrichum sojae]